MTERTIVLKMRCDCCNRNIPEEEHKLYFFQKDICLDCSARILLSLEKSKTITEQELIEIIDDIQYNI